MSSLGARKGVPVINLPFRVRHGRDAEPALRRAVDDGVSAAAQLAVPDGHAGRRHCIVGEFETGDRANPRWRFYRLTDKGADKLPGPGWICGRESRMTRRMKRN